MAVAEDLPGDGDANGSDGSVGTDLESVTSSELRDISNDLEGPKPALPLLHRAACAAVSLHKLIL